MIVSNLMFNMKRMQASSLRASKLFMQPVRSFCCQHDSKPEGTDGHDDFKSKTKSMLI